ncbi:hypothetical protein ACH5RR_002971 [Cinchona calisaya]|uniref:Uncharacterized protein n=1 Tax=Cinchona calisaya TaxID=153742 RepID=A0ABD3ATI0_9GENT
MHISSLLYYYKSDRAINIRYREIWYAFILQYKLLGVLDLGNVRLRSYAGRSDFVIIAKLVHLSSSAMVSVQQILGEQRDMSNNQLNVYIVGMI